MTYDFATQLAKGQAYEAVIDRWLSQWFEVMPATRDQQRCGIDRVLIREGHCHYVEIKADERAAQTGNAFIETVSVDTAGKPGWAFTSQADRLLYYVPPTLYICKFERLRERLPFWEVAYPIKDIPNQGYCTRGVLVPLDKFRDICHRIVDLSQVEGEQKKGRSTGSGTRRDDWQ